MKAIKFLATLSAVALTFVVLPPLASASNPETILLGAPAALTSSSTATFSFEAGGHAGGSDGVSFQCRLDSEGAWEPCASPVTYEGLADGPHRFEVRTVAARYPWERQDDQGDHADHRGHCQDQTPVVVEFTVDTTPPQTAIEAAPPGTIGTDEATLRFGAGEEGATFECRRDSADPVAWAPCTSPATFTGLADGPHTIEVRAIDAAGNVDPTPAVAAFAVDTTPPETNVNTAPSAQIEVNEATIAFSSARGTVFECRLDPQPASPWEPCEGSVHLAGLAAGWHTFEVRAGDGFGRFDPTPAVVTFFVDIPVNGARLAAAPLAGSVRIKTPGAAKFRPLTEDETIPVDSVVDTTAGKVSLTSVDQYDEEQRASFFDGTFRVEQQPGRRLVNLQLLDGRFEHCAAAGEGEARAAAAAPKSSLWGSGKGHFRTEGNYGAATVRGTIWLTEDTCEGTFVKVNRGIVSVRDFPRHKTISVPAGHSYLARNPAG